MPQILKQLAISIAGAIIVLLLIAIWDWASSGGVVAMLGGVGDSRFQEELNKVKKHNTA